MKHRISFFFRPIALQYLCVLCFLVGIPQFALGQKDTVQFTSDTGLQQPTPINLEKQVQSIQKAGKEEATRSIEKFAVEKDRIRQNQLLRDLQTIMIQTTFQLEKLPDSASFAEKILSIKSKFELAQDGIFVNTGTSQTHRNLTTSTKLLNELLLESQAIKEQTDRNYQTLVDIQFKIDSLYSDSILYKFPSDTVALNSYLKKMSQVAKEINPIDSALREAIFYAESRQLSINEWVNNLKGSIDQLNRFEKELYENSFNREFPNLLAPKGYSRKFSEILFYSWAKTRIALIYFLKNHFGKLILLMLLWFSLLYFIQRIQKNLSQKNIDLSGYAIIQHRHLTSITIVIGVFQFIFPSPPFLFNVILWAIALSSLTIVIQHKIDLFWRRIWHILLLLTALTCINNVILQASREERWLMVILNVAGLAVSIYSLWIGKNKPTKEKGIFIFLSIMALLLLPALLLNIYGRYNLSKTLLTSAYVNIVIGIWFLWVIRFLNEILQLANTAYGNQKDSYSIIDFQKIGNKVPWGFSLLLLMGWGILLGRNFYAFQYLTDPIKIWLVMERQIGTFKFTISNGITFFFILILSSVLSKVVSVIATEQDNSKTSDFKSGIGSWLLLIRIAIISTGIFLAFAASGIPLDKITIILGALSVGIGLGLQSLVNNLVSGLIIAFEKPINVGDIIEINGQSGRMKAIGFRSSVIATWDGADVIMPNGELLNAQLINWTKENHSRRLDLLIGVDYATDLKKATTLLQEILTADDRILNSPPCSVFVQAFNESSIDILLLFWIKDINDQRMIKSDLLTAIHNAFAAANISIPYPHQTIIMKPKEE